MILKINLDIINLQREAEKEAQADQHLHLGEKIKYRPPLTNVYIMRPVEEAPAEAAND